MHEFDGSSEIAAVFNLSAPGANASLPPCTLIKALSNFKRIPRTGCVCSMDERSRPLWAYPYFVPKSVDTTELQTAAPVKKGLNDTKELHLGDPDFPGFEYFGTYEAKLMDVGDEHKNFGAAPFPLGEAFSITMPPFIPRVRASAAALGLTVRQHGALKSAPACSKQPCGRPPLQWAHPLAARLPRPPHATEGGATAGWLTEKGSSMACALALALRSPTPPPPTVQVHIVEPVSKLLINISEQSTLDMFPPGVTDHLTFGEMAITLSHRKAWQVRTACKSTRTPPACTTGSQLRQRGRLRRHEWAGPCPGARTYGTHTSSRSPRVPL